VPELLEVETYRRALDAVVGRRIDAVAVLDPSYVRGGRTDELAAAVTGSTIESTARIGKLAIARLDSGHDLGLRFGMTGRLVVDGVAPIAELEYSSGRDEPAWDRFALRLADGGSVRMNDPRRFGSVELDPDVTRLGPDATVIGLDGMVSAMASDRAVKAVLLDQARIAGLGNLLADETLWRAGIDPNRTARSLGTDEVAHLRRVMRRTVAALGRRGGSHMGDLQVHRVQGGRCPADGAELLRRTIGGRTTISCPTHQR